MSPDRSESREVLSNDVQHKDLEVTPTVADLDASQPFVHDEFGISEQISSSGSSSPSTSIVSSSSSQVMNGDLTVNKSPTAFLQHSSVDSTVSELPQTSSHKDSAKQKASATRSISAFQTNHKDESTQNSELPSVIRETETCGRTEQALASDNSFDLDQWIAQDKQVIHTFASQVLGQQCLKCHAPLTCSLGILMNKLARRLEREQSLHSTIVCQFCNTAICAGCGNAPETTYMAPRGDSFTDYIIGWHCDTGRDYALWSLLCMLNLPRTRDLISSTSAPPRKRQRSHQSHKNLLAGVGYNKDSDASDREARKRSKPKGLKDSQLLPMFVALLKVIPTYVKPQDVKDSSMETFLCAIFRRSGILEKLTDLLRTDAIDQIAKRAPIYQASLTLLELMSTNSVLADLIYNDHVVNHSTHDLMALSIQITPSSMPQTSTLSKNLVQLLGILAGQASRFATRAQRDTQMFKEDLDMQDTIQLCDRIVSVHSLVCASDKNKRGSLGSAKAKGKANECRPEEEFENWHREYCVTEAGDEEIISKHHFAKEANHIKNSPKGRMRKLLMELTTLRASLPQGIFIRHGDSRIDVMKAIIIGPSGTPYENGLFEFDILCPENYPQEPPLVHFMTTGGGRAHFNPNLYQCGKVCLSLLGTWAGEPWRPNESTLLQVFVSMQAMIFSDEPWVNEPGREHMRGTIESTRYQHKIRELTIRYALVPWAHSCGNLAPSTANLWQDVVNKHFEVNVDRILYTSQRWCDDNAQHKKSSSEPQPGQKVPLPKNFGQHPFMPPSASWMTKHGKQKGSGPNAHKVKSKKKATKPKQVVEPLGPADSGLPIKPSQSAPSSSKTKPKQKDFKGPAYVGGKPPASTAAPPPDCCSLETNLRKDSKAQFKHCHVHSGPPTLASAKTPGSIVRFAGQAWTIDDDGRSLTAMTSAMPKRTLSTTAGKLWSTLSSAKKNDTGKALQGLRETLTDDSDADTPQIAKPDPAKAVRAYDGSLLTCVDLAMTDLPFDPAMLPFEGQSKLYHLQGQHYLSEMHKPRLPMNAIAYLLDTTDQGICNALTIAMPPWPKMPVFKHHTAPAPLATDSESDGAGEPSSLGSTMPSGEVGGSHAASKKPQKIESCLEQLKTALSSLPQGRVTQLELRDDYKAHELPDVEVLRAQEKAKAKAHVKGKHWQPPSPPSIHLLDEGESSLPVNHSLHLEF